MLGIPCHFRREGGGLHGELHGIRQRWTVCGLRYRPGMGHRPWSSRSRRRAHGVREQSGADLASWTRPRQVLSYVEKGHGHIRHLDRKRQKDTESVSVSRSLQSCVGCCPPQFSVSWRPLQPHSLRTFREHCFDATVTKMCEPKRKSKKILIAKSKSSAP